MFSLNYGLLLVLGIIAYIMIIDQNVADYFLLVFKMMKLNVVRLLWMIRFHPRNPITNLMMKWKYEKLARELQAEMEYKVTELNKNSKIVE